jgi:hypothetical protein
MVEMNPKDNATPYEHPNLDWDFKTMHCESRDGLYFETLYHIPTSPNSALVMVCI